MADNIRSIKWFIGIMLVGVIGFFVLPILVSMALSMVTIAACGVGLMALWFMLPAISESLAQLSYMLWTAAIKADPITKLKRELRDFAASIANTERRIAESNAQVMQLENMLKEHRSELGPEEINDWTAQIEMLRLVGLELIDLRNGSLHDYAEFERDIKKAEAQYKIGKAFKSALGAFTFDKKAGKETEGAKLAISEVQRQLAESQSKMQVVLSRKVTTRVPSMSGPAVQIPQSV